MTRVRNAFPAVRVFVFGQEVTKDVRSVTITLSDNARAPGTCEFVLASRGDRYVVTEDDIRLLNPEVESEHPEVLVVNRVLEPARDELVGPPVPPSIELSDLAAQSLVELSERRTDLTVVEQTELRQQLEAAFLDANPEVRVARATEALAQQNLEYVMRTQEAADSLDAIARENVELRVRDDVKRAILLAKIGWRVPVSQPAPGRTDKVSPEDMAHLRGEAYRFPFQVGDMIFSSNDPVRVFLRDPLKPAVWYYGFTGFVSGGGERNDANNQQLVTVRCEDVLRILRYARFTTNAGIFDIKALKQAQDAVVRTFYEDDFSKLNLLEFVFTMLFGSEAAAIPAELLKTTGGQAFPAIDASQLRVGVHASTEARVLNSTGAGAFDFARSAVCLYGNGEPPSNVRRSLDRINVVRLGQSASALGTYLAMVDHRVRSSDLETMFPTDLAAAGETPTLASALSKDALGEPQIEEVITAIGGHPERYPVDAGRLFVLAPVALGPDGEAATRSILAGDYTSVETRTTWRTRLARLYDILERAEFSFHASPRGDLLAEMPLWDFDPDDFSDTEITAGGTGAGTEPGGSSVSMDALRSWVPETRGPFGPHYRLARGDTLGWDRNLNDEQVRTQFVASWFPIAGYTKLGTGISVAGQTPAHVELLALIPAFGIRQETAEPTVYLSSPEAALYYCEVKLRQWNANARTSNLEMLPNLQLVPNRPLLQVERWRVMTVRRVIHSLVWGMGGTMTTRVDVNSERAWSGRTRPDGRRWYEAIGGSPSNPLDYGLLWSSR